jgi:hypothetical protein
MAVAVGGHRRFRIFTTGTVFDRLFAAVAG